MKRLKKCTEREAGEGEGQVDEDEAVILYVRL